MKIFWLLVLTCVSVLAVLPGCKNADVAKGGSPFLFSSDTIVLPVNFQSAVFHSNKILCLGEDGKLMAFDTLWQHDKKLTELLAVHAFNGMTVSVDTLFLIDGTGFWRMDDDFALHAYKPADNQFVYGLPMYADSVYDVYGCDVGEWGGAVFFHDRKNEITYTSQATCPQQVLKVNGKYIISSYLAHLSGYSDFLEISYPQQLYEYPIKRRALHCNWYVDDSLSGLMKNKQIKPEVAKTYGVKFSSACLTSFIYDTLLYSIYTTDVGTYLAQHRNDTLINTDTLYGVEIPAISAATLVKGGATVATFSFWIGRIGDDGKMQSEQSTGIIFIRGNRIRFLFSKSDSLKTRS